MCVTLTLGPISLLLLLLLIFQGLAAMVGADRGSLQAQRDESSNNDAGGQHPESQSQNAANPSRTGSTSAGGNTARLTHPFPSEDVAVFECQASQGYQCRSSSQELIRGFPRAIMRMPSPLPVPPSPPLPFLLGCHSVTLLLDSPSHVAHGVS